MVGWISNFCVLQVILLGAKRTINRYLSYDGGGVETRGLKMNPNKDGGLIHVWTLGYNTDKVQAWMNF